MRSIGFPITHLQNFSLSLTRFPAVILAPKRLRREDLECEASVRQWTSYDHKVISKMLSILVPSFASQDSDISTVFSFFEIIINVII